MGILLGTTVNAFAIITGGILGLLLKGGIPEKVKESVMNGLALCVLLIGISGAIKVDNLLLVIFSIVLGSIIGELIDFDNLLQRFGDRIERQFKGKGGKVSEGFVTSSLLFCVGAMAIVGSLESGLNNNHQTIFAKSMIDGITSIVFASSMGIGVLLSAITVFVYQGTITLGATSLSTILVPTVRLDMTAVGSLLIIGLSLNMLKITKIKVANLLPAVVIPILYQILSPYFSMIGQAFKGFLY
ncbi:MAG: DUF554 domain-containing protein [Clostridiaceae bacterium]|nr:DUF554 domain-containing protein [Clostridiaceae bacterium]